MFPKVTGVYGTNYLNRATVAFYGLGANRPQDAIYPTSELDAEGKLYSGANKYVMHFDRDQMPPAKGFWSLTRYDANYFFVANPLNRYTLSARNKLKTNADGSVDLLIQQSPRARARNLTGCRASRQVCSDATSVLAWRDVSLATRRELDDSGGAGGTIKRGPTIFRQLLAGSCFPNRDFPDSAKPACGPRRIRLTADETV